MRSALLAARLSGRGLVAVIAGALVLAGCTGSTGAPPTRKVSKPTVSKPAAEAMAPAPKVGDCWNTSPGLLVGATWEGSKAIPCSQKHNAVTYRVGTLPAGFSYATIDTHRLASTKVVADSCNERAAHTYLGHGNFHPPLRVDEASFAPSSQQWAAGAPWFRCDLGFPDNYLEANQREWQTVPADLRAAVEADDRPFSICSNGSVKGGPSRVNVTFGKCGKGMHWVVTRSADIANKRGDPYPGTKVSRRRALQACHSPLEYWTTWERADDWNDGKTRASCWERWNGG